MWIWNTHLLSSLLSEKEGTLPDRAQHTLGYLPWKPHCASLRNCTLRCVSPPCFSTASKCGHSSIGTQRPVCCAGSWQLPFFCTPQYPCSATHQMTECKLRLLSKSTIEVWEISFRSHPQWRENPYLHLLVEESGQCHSKLSWEGNKWILG